MSWKDPVPPVTDYWTGLSILTLTLLVMGGPLYALLA